MCTSTPEDKFSKKQSWEVQKGMTHPADQQKRKVVTGLEIFDNPIGWYIHQDVRNVEDKQSNIELVSVQLEIFGEPVDSCISNVGSINEGKKPE
jgi:hypothetical protein